MSDDPEINLLKRQVTEAMELYHQAISLAAAANVRLDALASVVANLERRIAALRVESKTISELVG